MKKWILVFCFLLQPLHLWADGGVTVGNGGDSTSPQILTSQEIKEMTLDSRNILLSIFNSLDLQSSDANFNSQDPVYFKKLFSNQGHLIEMTTQAKINVFDDRSCLDLSGAEKDASATLTPYPQICISSLRLQGKLTRQDAYVRLGGLMAHEFSHLSGTTEDEAIDFQKRIESLLTDTSKKQWEDFVSLAQGRVDFLGFLYGASLLNETAEKNWSESCKDANSADTQYQSLLPGTNALSRYNSKTYPVLIANFVRHKLVMDYVCSKAGIAGDEINQSLGDRYLDEMPKDLLTIWGAFYDIPMPHMFISKIKNDTDLKTTIETLTNSF